MPLTALVILLSGALSPVGEIAFVDEAGTPTSRVCVIDLEADVKSVVGPGDWDGAPHWSPDGQWLAFETGGGDDRSIYVVRADGAEGRVLDLNHAWNVMPRWSTDGARLVYVAATGRGGLGGVNVYDLNSGEERVWGGGQLGLLRPVWMPYSKLMLALEPDTPLSVPGVNMERFLSEARMGRDSIQNAALPEAVVAIQVVPGMRKGRGMGMTVVLLTESEVLPFLGFAGRKRKEGADVLWQVEPNWGKARHDFSRVTERAFGAAPLLKQGEATRIAYESDEGGDREIFVLGKKGIANVTNHRAADWNPVWSPDGKRIAFESFRGGHRGVYRVYADTALVTAVSAGDGASWSPTWSPDGAWIGFVSDQGGVASLHVARESGGASRRYLSKEDSAKAWPAWRPEHK